MNLNSCPKFEDMVKYDFCTINEVVHLLVGWPKEFLKQVELEIFPEIEGWSRTYYFLPAVATSDFDKKFGKGFFKTYNFLKAAIECGSLKSYNGIGEEDTTMIISLREASLLAIKHHFILSKELQQAFGFWQTIEESKDTIKRKIKRKIIGQVLLQRNPDLQVNQMIAHPMFKLGELDERSCADHKGAKRALRELLPDGDRRRNKQKYIPHAIPEVIKVSRDGTHEYHVPHLILALEILTRAKIITSDEDLAKQSLRELYTEFMNDEVFKLYTHNLPTFLQELVHPTLMSTIFNQLFNKEIYDLSEAITRTETLGVSIPFPLENGRYRLEEKKGKRIIF